MRIQYMSDLHMELWDNSRYIKANEFDAVGDVTVRGIVGNGCFARMWATITTRWCALITQTLSSLAYEHRHHNWQHPNRVQPTRLRVLQRVSYKRI